MIITLTAVFKQSIHALVCQQQIPLNMKDLKFIASSTEDTLGLAIFYVILK